MSQMDVKITGTGSNADTEAQVDPTFKALRASLRSLDFIDAAGVVGGHYRVGAKSGSATVIAAAGAIFSFRCSDPARICAINRVQVGFLPTTGFTAAQSVDVDLVRVTGFTASDTGGTAIVPGSANKKRTAMGNSLVADARIATTAALGAGTGTADANPLAVATVGAQTGATNITTVFPVQALFDSLPGQEHPLILLANEGFRIRLATTMGAAGVGNFTVNVDWAELPFASL